MIFYLTANEYYSGIYQGQVIDVVRFFSEKLKTDIRLVAFIPITGFWKARNQIKMNMTNAIVLPMLPKQSKGTRWKQSRWLLYLVCKIYKCKSIVARNPLATWIAISAKEKGYVSTVCYDGRGAVAAESEEYNIYPSAIASQMVELEKKAVLDSDFQICITEYLLSYWKDKYGYTGNSHFIIPGTLNTNFLNLEINDEIKEEERKKNGFSENDILLIYAGSTEGWQSFQLIYDFLKVQFVNNPVVKVLFLSKEEENIKKLAIEFPQNVKQMWLVPSEVNKAMMMGDYGLIVREKSVTNAVAFPTKFPEYLACGLSVIANDAVKEISSFIIKNNCGYIIDSQMNVQLPKNSIDRMNRNRILAMDNFNKEAGDIKNKYWQLIAALN